MALTVPESEQLFMVRLLKAGIPVSRVADRTGWSEPTVRKVQREHGLRPRRVGERDIAPSVVEVFEERDEEEVPAPWRPRPGWDLYASRPHQARWVELLTAADPREQGRMWQAICSVIGTSRSASAETIARVLGTDRRPADELARLYLATLEAS